MAAIASPEFLSLCQVQLRLLIQQMEESSAAIYIAELATDDSAAEEGEAYTRQQSSFAPVVSYPESIERWVENFEGRRGDSQFRVLALPGSAETALSKESKTSASKQSTDTRNSGEQSSEQSSEKSSGDKPPSDRASDRAESDSVFDRAKGDHPWPELQSDRRLVVPLVYSDVVVGLLVTVRRDRAWREDEQQHIEAVAQMLAASCVLERRNQWLQAQLSNKRALQSRQSEIFHNLLHQFRNPLTAVTTFGQLLVRRLEPEDSNKPVATGIVRESKRLREMVAHFDETVAIGDANLADDVALGPPLLPPAPLSLPPRTEPVVSAAGDRVTAAAKENGTGTGLGHALTLSAQYLPDILEPVLAVADIVATEKGIELHAQVAPDTPSVWGDEEALGEVVSNLVDNAVKYTPAGAQVWVQTGVSRMRQISSRYSAQGQYQGIVVGDTGPGIPADDLVRLFERNYRGVQAEGDIPGTGLGLAIAQSLTAEMQGFIEVVSPAAGTPWLPLSAFDAHSGPGTVFIVWLLEVERRVVD
ncbi:ATPase, histidine kinase-, DNA gyrase B-, and HSP90-like domain protein [Synechococcus sp. PCC 7335]|uniref:sensor histidine kinase n=1 Tax=Synechococcus sp. (strain ATCC 29403 / PCC 7335) TaxID=91464 RepID=UPI00017EDCFB|nr:GAF domain-containing sensor histidine kinase [Synechococcus sp. PCC 7335]EDX84139.1 ATPase, histidine kinase-, DNA gyrase B-, and HSP90-like domain protein [Synechococcus sp. PCC 7335]